MPDHRHRPSKRPVRAPRIPESLAGRVSPELAEAMNLAFEEHPDLAQAFLPPDTPGVSTYSYDNWIGSETKR